MPPAYHRPARPILRCMVRNKVKIIGAMLIPLLLLTASAPALHANQPASPLKPIEEIPKQKDIVDHLLESLLLIYPEDISTKFPYPQCGDLCNCVIPPLSPLLNSLPPLLVCIMGATIPPLEPAINSTVIPCCADKAPSIGTAVAPPLCHPLIGVLFPLLGGLVSIIVKASAYPYETEVLLTKVIDLIIQHPEMLVNNLDEIAMIATGGPMLLCLNPTQWSKHPYWNLAEMWSWANLPGSIYAVANGIVSLMSSSLSSVPLASMTGIVDLLPTVVPRPEGG